MAKDGKTKKAQSLLFVFLAEGETEAIIYQILLPKYLPKSSYKIFDIGRQNRVRAALAYSEPSPVNKTNKLRIVYCVDNEKIYEGPHDFDIGIIREKCIEKETRNVLSIDDIVANQMSESWFFYDIEGIYDYLEVKTEDRKPLEKYKTPHKCRKGDLKVLFKKHNKCYHEGKRAKDFYESLNWDLIIQSCPELNAGIKLIKSKANDLTSELFPHRNKAK